MNKKQLNQLKLKLFFTNEAEITTGSL